MFQGNEKSVYELVVRHFLACISKDAEGLETTIEIEINTEKASSINFCNYLYM